MKFSAMPVLALLSATATAALSSGLTVASGTSNSWNTIPMGPGKPINGEGLPGDVPALSGTHTTNFDNGWWSFSSGANPAGITIDLGAIYDLDIIQIKPLDSCGGSAGVPNDVGLAEVQFGGKLAPGASGFQLIIIPDGSNDDSSWSGRNGELYDLVSSTDLSTPILNWPVYAGHQDIFATAPTNTLPNVVPEGAKRFFAVIEKNGSSP